MATNLFEQDFNKRISVLNAKMEKLATKLQRTIQQALTNPSSSTAYWASVNKEIEILYAEMNETFALWVSKNVPNRFIRSIKNMMNYINKQKIITERAARTFTKMINSRYVTNISQILYQDAILSMSSALDTGKRNMLRLTRLTQQKLIDESLINFTLADTLVGGDLKAGISQLHLQLLNALGNKQFVQAGSRKYNPAYYAEMIGRVKFHEAQAQGALITCANYDTDIIQVSSHNTTTEICMPFEGKIFSISGNDKRFPPLDDIPPFHPNCLHNLYPYFESAMEATGTTKGWSDFSWGITDRPPGNSSFIPLSERTIV